MPACRQVNIASNFTAGQWVRIFATDPTASGRRRLQQLSQQEQQEDVQPVNGGGALRGLLSRLGLAGASSSDSTQQQLRWRPTRRLQQEVQMAASGVAAEPPADHLQFSAK